MTTEWKIRRKQGLCSLCGHAFEDGERLRSLLCIEEAQIARRDVCEACRAATPDEDALAERVRAAAEAERALAAQERAAGREAPESGAIEGAVLAAGETSGPEAPAVSAVGPFALYWWSTRHRVTRRATVQLDLDTIERLFVDLEGRPEQKLRELRYLLCLLLMRKRRVKLDAVRRGADGEALLVHRPRRTERLVVYVHEFGPERMDELRERLQALLEGVEPDGAESDGAGPDGAESDRVESDRVESDGAESDGAGPNDAGPGREAQAAGPADAQDRGADGRAVSAESRPR
jgi:hypothetical protein